MSKNTGIQYSYADNSCNIELQIKNSLSSKEVEGFLQNIRRCEVFMGDYYFLTYVDGQLFIFRSSRRFDWENLKKISLDFRTKESALKISLPCQSPDKKNDQKELHGDLNKVTERCSLKIDDRMDQLIAHVSEKDAFNGKFRGKIIRFQSNLDNTMPTNEEANASDSETEAEAETEADEMEMEMEMEATIYSRDQYKLKFVKLERPSKGAHNFKGYILDRVEECLLHYLMSKSELDEASDATNVESLGCGHIPIILGVGCDDQCTSSDLNSKLTSSADNLLALLTFMDLEADECDKDTIGELVRREIVDHKRKLVQIQEYIENKFHKSLSPVDVAYIEGQYIEHLLKLWLSEVTVALQQMADKKSDDIIQKIFNRLDNIESLTDIPDPLKNLELHALLLSHYSLIGKDAEVTLVDKFKRACLQQVVSYNETVEKELNLLKLFVDLLSESRNIRSIIAELDLLNFCKGKSSFGELLRRTLELDVKIHGSILVALQEAAKKLLDETDLFLKGIFKETIAAYIMPVVVELRKVDNRSIIEVRGKNIVLSDHLPELEKQLSTNPNIEEVRFVGADVMHVDKDLSNNIWHGRNVIIYVKSINVLNQITWDVSGEDNRHSYSSNAGTGADGHGNRGDDGYAGESGGNVLILATEIRNHEKWIIISDGGKGSKGQGGGNGHDGADGRGIDLWEFDEKYPPVVYMFHAKWLRRDPVDKLIQQLKYDCSHIMREWHNKGDDFIEGMTAQGNRITFGYYYASAFTHYQAYLLYEGSPGKSGGHGGEYGLGGQGGYPGEIFSRNPETGQDYNIARATRTGKDGDNGKGGLYGKHGKNGWDMGYLNFQFWDDPRYFGRDKNSKLELEYSDDSAGRVWCNYVEKYVGIRSHQLQHNINQEYQQRRNTRQNYERQHQAQAIRKKAISQSSIMTNYSAYFSSVEKSLMQDLSSEMESRRLQALQAITDLQQQQQRVKHTVEVAVRRHVSSAQPAEKGSTSFTGSSAKYKDTATADDTITKVKVAPKVLDNWLELKHFEVDRSKLNGLYDSFDAVKQIPQTNNADKSKVSAIEKLLIDKYRLATLQEIANRLRPYSSVSDTVQLTPQSAARYLVEDKVQQDISHPILGTLNQYLYHTTIEQHEKILKMSLENEPSLKMYVIQVGRAKDAPPAIKQFYEEYRTFSEKNERSLAIAFESFKSELSQPRHAKLFELWMESTKDKSLKPKLETKIQKDKYLKALHSRCKALLKLEDDWDKRCKTQSILTEFHDYLLEKGPLAESYRDLLAKAFDINIRVYAEGEDNKLYLLDNHNPSAKQFIYILCRNEQFVQLSVDNDHYRLEEVRQQNDIIYRQILVELDSINEKRQLDEYLLKETFLKEKVQNKPDLAFYNEKDNIRQIVEYFPEEERHQLRARLSKITVQYVGQRGIFHSIAHRFSVEGRRVSVQELCLLINAILSSSVEGSVERSTFCWIVSAYSQRAWIDELILLKLENYFKKPLTKKIQLRSYLRKIENIDVLLLLHVKLDQIGSDSSIPSQCIEDILHLLSNIPSKAELNLDGLNLPEWSYALKEKYWIFKLSTLVDWQENDLHTSSYYILSVENISGTDLCEKFIETIKGKAQQLTSAILTKILCNFHNEEWSLSEQSLQSLDRYAIVQWTQEMTRKFSAIDKDRTVEQLVEIVKGNATTSPSIVDQLIAIEKYVKSIRQSEYLIAGRSVGSFTEDNIKDWSTKIRASNTRSDDNHKHVMEMFAVIDRAIKLKRGWNLRDTQRLSTMVLLTNNRNTLAQVATGEGKSIVVVALAIVKALCGQKVDIITSSSVLAKRDAEENKDIYGLFDVSVSHNCGEDIDTRKAAYSSNQVVYGDLSNFQRDYLLDTFYGKNILGDHTFENVVVDEVDSMLLDKGNNILYLSHDLPGLDKLESLYIFIWQWLNRPTWEPEEVSYVFDTTAIKEAILNDIYGLITEDDIGKIDSKLTNAQVNRMHECLITAGVLDERNAMIKESLDDIKLDEVLPSEFTEYKQRLRYLLKDCLEREKRIRIPNYLRPFVEQHLESWIESAKIAFFMKAGEDYVVDVDRTGSSADRNPNITILDRDTGTDQANSQWDEALHQFLQLKHGCKISIQSLKAVFISNVSFFKLYRNLYGLTGTLGSQRERDLLRDIHQVDFVIIPTAKSKRFTEHTPILCTTTADWITQIRDSIQKLIGSRSVLIICETVNDVNAIHRAFGRKGTKDVHTYTRDYEVFDLAQDGKKLEKGHVIIATNLAGRGTDIKITKELNEAGGLHVCLTYLPANVRIEQQAFGRSARKGERGSGQLILLDTKGQQSSKSTIFDLRKDCHSEELRRLSEIKTHYETQITVEEKCFQAFQVQYEHLKKSLDDKKIPAEVQEILLHTCLDKWAFWLDKNCSLIKNLIDEPRKRKFDDLLNSFISQLKFEIVKGGSKNWSAWVEGNPAQMIKLGKFLTKTGKKEHTNAIELFEKVISQEATFSEAAHYYKALVYAKQLNWEETPVDEQVLAKFQQSLRNAARLFGEHSQSATNAAAYIRKITLNVNESIIRVDAYEEQQKSLANLYFMYSQSIDDIFGKALTPTALLHHDVNEELAATLFADLLREGILKKPRVAANIPGEKLKIICSDYGIAIKPLKDFLSNYQGSEINEQDFQKALKKRVFLPSREVFWRSLLDQGILKNDIKYIMIDKGRLDEMNSPLLNLLRENIDTNTLQAENLTSSNVQEIFLKAELLIEPDKSYIFKKPHFVATLGRDKYLELKKIRVLFSNRTALVDRSKLDSVSFAIFDSIALADFDMVDIPKDEAEKIVTELVGQNVIVKKKDSVNGDYALIAQYEDIEQIKLLFCPLYENAVKGLLSACFAFRLALQRLVRQLDDKSLPVRLQLVTKPHYTLVSDLLEYEVVRQSPSDCSDNNIEESLQKILRERNLKLSADTILNITKSLKDSRGALKNLEVPDSSLQPIADVYGKFDFGSVEEMNVFSLNGMDTLIQLEEKKWTLKMLLNTALVAIIGIAQIAAGTAIELFSVGIMTNVASAFISEGIGDIIFAAGALRSGYFSWKDYMEHKIESLIITAATAGVGALLARGAKLSRFGHKLAGPVFQIGGKKVAEMSGRELIKNVGLKLVAKQVMKRVAIKSIKNISLSLANEGFELLIENKIVGLCRSMSSTILAGIKDKIQKHPISQSLREAYQAIDEQQARQMLKTISQSFFTVKVIDKYFSVPFKKTALKVFRQVAKSLKKLAKNSTVKFLISGSIKFATFLKHMLNIVEILTMADNFLNEVDAKVKANLKILQRSKDAPKQKKEASETDCEQFQREIIGEWTSLLTEKVSGLVQKYIVMPILDKRNDIINAVARKLKDVYSSRNESGHLKRFNSLKREYQEELQKIRTQQDNDSSTTESHINEKYHADLQRLMMKTRSPKLFADIVRENAPMDMTCVSAATKVVHKILKEQGLGAVTIVVEGENGRQKFSSDPEEEQDGKLVKLHLQSNHFQLVGSDSPDDNTNHNSLYEALSEAIPQLRSITPKQFIDKASSYIEQDDDIQTHIKNGWHRLPISTGAFTGGRYLRLQPHDPTEYLHRISSSHDHSTISSSSRPHSIAEPEHDELTNIIGRSQTISGEPSEWHGHHRLGQASLGQQQTKKLKQIESVNFKRSLTAEDADTIRHVKEDLMAELDNKINKGQLGNEEKARLKTAQDSLADMKIHDVFALAKEYYTQKDDDPIQFSHL